MGTYNTSQKQELLNYLVSHADKQYTVEELTNRINESDSIEKTVGKSTVYRLINKMLDEGIVRRTVKGNSRQFLYQYAAAESCKSHLHMKCRECGKILHMDDKESKNLMEILQETSKFSLDLKDTLLLGSCDKCSLK